MTDLSVFFDFPTTRLDFVSNVIDPQPDHRAPELAETNGYPYIGIRDINPDGSINVETARKVKLEAVKKQELAFRLFSGDIVFCKVGTLGLPRRIKPVPQMALSATLVLIKPQNTVDSQFLFYALDSDPVKSQCNLESTGSTRQALGIQQIRRFDIPFTSLDRQRSIAAFLDRKTAAIDTLIAKKQRLIQLLEEKRTALINQAVTKGLNPNAPMKDSGIPWIGEIPKHWESIQLRRCIRHIEQGWSPVAEDRIAQENEWSVLKLNSVSKGEFHPTEHKVLPEDTEPDKRFEVKHGDLLLSRANTPQLVGEACYVENPPSRLMLSDLLYRLDIDECFINKRFCTYYLLSKSGKSQISADARGTSQSMVKISQGHIKAWIIPFPPSLEEQESIANYLDARLAFIKNITNRVVKQIEKLQEYRRSLITAAVTGKLEIEEDNAA